MASKSAMDGIVMNMQLRMQIDPNVADNEQRKILSSLFRVLDADTDGFVTRDELNAGNESLQNQKVVAKILVTHSIIITKQPVTLVLRKYSTSWILKEAFKSQMARLNLAMANCPWKNGTQVSRSLYTCGSHSGSMCPAVYSVGSQSTLNSSLCTCASHMIVTQV